MQVDITPETAQLVREEISSDHFQSVDDLIKAGVEALRKKSSFADARLQTLASILDDPGSVITLAEFHKGVQLLRAEHPAPQFAVRSRTKDSKCEI
jgi:Arc/MetJ-type ribon-helix-helix transcriptional regulator